MPSIAMSLITSFCYLAIFLISPFSFVASTRTLPITHQLGAPQELDNHRHATNESRRRNLGYFSNEYYNDIDSCWIGPDWMENRKTLANCVPGYASGTLGGVQGPYYVVTSTEDVDPANPVFGTLRHAVTRLEPLWITFKYEKMVFRLKQELIIASYKTLDGRGSEVHIPGPACPVLQSVEHVILSNLYIYNCRPTGGDGTEVMSNETHVGVRGPTDGDAVSLWQATYVWADHLYLSRSYDGLFDAVEGSTNITLSNSRLTNHNEVMLFGHNDSYVADRGLEATLLYNHFGPNLTQRIPRLRFGYVQVINNLYLPWGMYAIGGSSKATIMSTGNRYIASDDVQLKEVTKHLDLSMGDWGSCNWASVDDQMVNGALFTPSGHVDAKASTLSAKHPTDILMLVANAGPLPLLCDKNLPGC